ncbi:hypothetical protein M422DRAFT_263566, partial [Sphaerobolus stellatus SS14]
RPTGHIPAGTHHFQARRERPTGHIPAGNHHFQARERSTDHIPAGNYHFQARERSTDHIPAGSYHFQAQERSIDHVAARHVHHAQEQTYVAAVFVYAVTSWFGGKVLFGLSTIYSNRLYDVFMETGLGLEEGRESDRRTVDSSISTGNNDEFSPLNYDSAQALHPLEQKWKAFIKMLLQEWNTCNVVSALFLSAILTILQIPPIANVAVTRYLGLVSLNKYDHSNATQSNNLIENLASMVEQAVRMEEF